MSVYQKWQENRDDAVEKLEEAEEYLRDCLKNAKDSPEPPNDEFKREVRKASIEIIDLIDRLS